MIKKKQIMKDYNKLKKIANRYIEKKRYDKALGTIQVLGNYMYNINLFYTDEEVEKMIKRIASDVVDVKSISNQKKRMLFYDGFGLDTRGLALIYLKALVSCGYEILYVTLEKKELNIPLIEKTIKEGNGEIKVIQAHTLCQGIKQLNELIIQYGVNSAFIYTYPSDMIGITVFTAYVGKIKRYMINLTDHAFWLGKYAFDYILEFRDYGASISIDKRKICKECILKQPYYPFIDKQTEFQGFPFETKNFRVIFSGGNLYKTFGGDNRYYDIVDHILKKYSDTIFVYAGFGKGDELLKLKEKYSNRVYWIEERKDLYQIMKHSYFYLSTYPMIGGLMTQYAVAAGTIPFTLIYDDCATGILMNSELIESEYREYQDFLRNIDSVLDSSKELEKRKAGLEKQLISPEQFKENLNRIVNDHESRFPYVNNHVNTENFQYTYLERMVWNVYCSLFLKRDKLFLVKFFPFKCSIAIIRETKERICK